MENIYDRFVAAGCEIANHESDLYVKNTDAARTVISEWEQIEPQKPLNLKTFVSEATGLHWFELPFQFTPFWDRKQRTSCPRPPA